MEDLVPFLSLFQEMLVKYCQGSDIDSRIGTATSEGGQRNVL